MKKVLLGFVAVLIVFEILSYVEHGLILRSAYESSRSIFRPDMDSLMWIYQVLMVVGAFFFSFIFSKGYEKKGVGEGIRYGLYMGIWLSLGMAYGTYAMMAIPYSLALQWFIYGIITYIIAGIVLSLVYRPMAKADVKA